MLFIIIMKRIVFMLATLLIFCLYVCKAEANKATAKTERKQKYDVAAYLYPAYAYNDPRLRPFWPSGMGEWETVQTMQQRNPGHYWNRQPLWGPINEADPAVMDTPSLP